MPKTAPAKVRDPPVLCDGCGLLCLQSELRLRRDIEADGASGLAGGRIAVEGAAARWVSPTLVTADDWRVPQRAPRSTDRLCFECYFLAEQSHVREVRAQRRSTLVVTAVTLALSALAVWWLSPRAYSSRVLVGRDAYKAYVKQPLLAPTPYKPPFGAPVPTATSPG